MFIVAGVVETAVNDLFINTTVNLPGSKYKLESIARSAKFDYSHAKNGFVGASARNFSNRPTSKSVRSPGIKLE